MFPPNKRNGHKTVPPGLYDFTDLFKKSIRIKNMFQHFKKHKRIKGVFFKREILTVIKNVDVFILVFVARLFNVHSNIRSHISELFNIWFASAAYIQCFARNVISQFIYINEHRASSQKEWIKDEANQTWA